MKSVNLPHIIAALVFGNIPNWSGLYTDYRMSICSANCTVCVAKRGSEHWPLSHIFYKMKNLFRSQLLGPLEPEEVH